MNGNEIVVVDKGNGWKEAQIGGSRMVCHVGGEFVGREALVGLPLPEATKSWKPIAHSLFISQLDQALASRGHKVVAEKFALSKNGLKMYGVLQMNDRNEAGVSSIIGVRNSNDKSVSIRGYAGDNLFICDNDAMSGQTIVLARKHTSRIDLDLEVGRGVQKWEIEMNRHRGVLKKLQEVEIGTEKAKELIYRALVEDEVMPLRLARRIHDAHFGLLKDAEEPLNEKFAEWGGNTAWRLSNAFTWAAQEMPLMARGKALVKVGSFFEATVGAN